MRAVVKFLTSRLFLAFLGVLFLSLFIWFAGPLIGFGGRAPLAAPLHRLLAIGGLSGVWLASALLRFIRARRRNAAMLDAIASDTRSASEEASAEERAALNAKMQEAIATLKERNFARRGGARFIYELPWYMIIGPPGAGKTTLLGNSGLDFPLEQTHGRYSVKGVGGTRNCDWWFTDQAVLLDTAGRYTTQDSEAEVDRAAWSGFLDILKRHRSRRPLNGLLVALSVEDLIAADDDSLLQSARTIRSRIDELYSRLGIAPPVYLLITKCDLLAGFSEFFADLDSREREQVWGFTLPLNAAGSVDEQIARELHVLGRLLGRQSIDRMQGELNLDHRERIYGFPMQFALLRERVRVFAGHLTARSRLLEKLFFRGLYFTSATQTGSVIDQVIARVSQSFGITDQGPERQAESGKSFFIHQTLKQVIFPEAGLAGTNLETETRLKRLQLGATAAIALVLLGLATFWTFGYLGNDKALERVDEATGRLGRSLSELSGDSLDLLQTSRALDDVLALRFADAAPAIHDSLPVRRAGLYQGHRIDAMVDDKYQALLIDALLPRLLIRLENQMHAQNDKPEFLFEALKTYLMIDDAAHFDSDAVIGWFNFDFRNNLPADTPNEARTRLRRHVSALFADKPRRLPRPLDGGLIAQYQRLAANVSIEQRSYNRILNTHQAGRNSFLSLTSRAGSEVPLALDRRDDVSLDQSIPVIFTRQGYRELFLPASRRISATLADDSWVLGTAGRFEDAVRSPDALASAVAAQYFADYIASWEELIRALKLRSVDGLLDASRFISLISAPDSPLKRLLVVIAEETTLTDAQTVDAEGESAAAPATDRENTLGTLLGGASAAGALPAESPTLDPVTRHFRPLHDLVRDWQGNASALDQVLGELARINLQLLPMAQSPSGAVDQTLTTALAVNLQSLNTRADRLPEPLASLVKSVTNDVSDVAGGGLCQQLDSAWQTDVFAYYQRAISGRYPVNREGTADIALADFATFFAPGGIVDRYVDTYLANLVAKTPRQWTWTGRGSAVCVSSDTLTQLARADEIKRTFFTQGAQLPAFSFDVIPERLSMSPDIDQLVFSVGGRSLSFFHGPIAGSTSFSWPDASNTHQVSLQVAPVIPGASSSLAFSGPWAVLRLLDLGSRTREASGLTVEYSFSGRRVTMGLATSSFNPLDSRALRNFRCPETL